MQDECVGGCCLPEEHGFPGLLCTTEGTEALKARSGMKWFLTDEEEASRTEFLGCHSAGSAQRCMLEKPCASTLSEAVRRGNPKYGFAVHVQKTNHYISWEEATVQRRAAFEYTI